jgi:hypothetical protein
MPVPSSSISIGSPHATALMSRIIVSTMPTLAFYVVY